MTAPAARHRRPPEIAECSRIDLPSFAELGAAMDDAALDDLAAVCGWWLAEGRFRGHDLGELLGVPPVDRGPDPRARRRELLLQLAERCFAGRAVTAQAHGIDRMSRDGVHCAELAELEDLAQQTGIRWPIRARRIFTILCNARA